MNFETYRKMRQLQEPTRLRWILRAPSSNRNAYVAPGLVSLSGLAKALRGRRLYWAYVSLYEAVESHDGERYGREVRCVFPISAINAESKARDAVRGVLVSASFKMPALVQGALQKLARRV